MQDRVRTTFQLWSFECLLCGRSLGGAGDVCMYLTNAENRDFRIARDPGKVTSNPWASPISISHGPYVRRWGFSVT